MSEILKKNFVSVSPDKADASSSVEVTVDPNPTGTDRTETVAFSAAGQSVNLTVSQERMPFFSNLSLSTEGNFTGAKSGVVAALGQTGIFIQTDGVAEIGHIATLDSFPINTSNSVRFFWSMFISNDMIDNNDQEVYGRSTLDGQNWITDIGEFQGQGDDYSFFFGFTGSYILPDLSNHMLIIEIGIGATGSEELQQVLIRHHVNFIVS